MLVDDTHLKVNAISMVNEDGDKLFDEIIQKLSNGYGIDKRDIIKLTFTPVMGGKIYNKAQTSLSFLS